MKRYRKEAKVIARRLLQSRCRANAKSEKDADALVEAGYRAAIRDVLKLPDEDWGYIFDGDIKRLVEE